MKKKGDVSLTVRKLDKRMKTYFGNQYRMNDFVLSGMVLATDIDVGTHENVLTYLKVLQRIGKVKGFTPSAYDCFEADESFCLDGNSNGIQLKINVSPVTISKRQRIKHLKCLSYYMSDKT